MGKSLRRGRERAAFTLVEAVAALALLTAAIGAWVEAVSAGLKVWTHERATLNGMAAERALAAYTKGKPLTVEDGGGRLSMPGLTKYGQPTTVYVEVYQPPKDAPAMLRVTTAIGGHMPLVENVASISFTALGNGHIGFRLVFLDSAVVMGVLDETE
ncbi:hypothetical protein [Lacticaseibacillus kribbianus]|uniref:hypothetical protein n=1 Tax=Lacticaseibacillus kribbianus TaxID=2926292 RepID=UPI001CD2A0E6|nr:hypothetical protein [Lacticaseibacillus kribbianus]